MIVVSEEEEVWPVPWQVCMLVMLGMVVMVVLCCVRWEMGGARTVR